MFLFIYDFLVYLPLFIIGFFIAIFIIRKSKTKIANYDYLDDQETFEKIDEEIVKKFEDNKVVLKGTLKRPRNYNDKQAMTKYNKNTYRDEKGRYASLNIENHNE